MTEEAAESTRIEQHTIFPIPANERHGRARDLFTVWFGSNIMILTIVTGSLATMRFALSLAAAIFAILIGNANLKRRHGEAQVAAAGDE